MSMSSFQQQARAWSRVYDALCKIDPDWSLRRGAASDLAVAMIERLGKNFNVDLADQLESCREDWQRVCDALGTKGHHLDPDDVVTEIEALKSTSAERVKLLQDALEVVHADALSLRESGQVGLLVADPQTLAEIHSLERLASRLARAIKEN